MLLSSGKDPYWEGWVSSDPENVCRLCSMMSTVLIFMDGLLPQVEKFKHRFGGGRLSYFPAHTCGQKVLVVTKRISSWMQAVKVRFLLRVCGHNLGITVIWSVVCASQGDQKKEVWASLPRLLPDTLYRMDRWTSYSNYYPNMSFRTLQGLNIVA